MLQLCSWFPSYFVALSKYAIFQGDVRSIYELKVFLLLHLRLLSLFQDKLRLVEYFSPDKLHYLYVVIATVVMVLQSHHSEREHDVHPGGDHHPPHTVSVMGVVPRIAGAGEGAMVALVQQTATNCKE